MPGLEGRSLGLLWFSFIREREANPDFLGFHGYSAVRLDLDLLCAMVPLWGTRRVL